jgi:hypothetical protein
MGWLRQLQIRRAAKQYARRLPPQLARAYGSSESYSRAQVQAASAKLGLNPKYIALGYAAFLPEETFSALTADMAIYISYREAREVFHRFRPRALFSVSGNPETSINITQAGISDHPDLS